MTVVEEKLKGFTKGLDNALNEKNYYAALSIGFTLPDICSKLEYPKVKTGKRYPKWYEEFMQSKYESLVGAEYEKHIFLNGHDFYALRCAFLHQGEGNITEQQARKILTDFKFVASNGKIHCNSASYSDGTSTLQLDVGTFCRDILEGADAWLTKHCTDSNINARAANLVEISDSQNFSF